MVNYKDIAAKCNVSTATVSYVLNGKGSVSPAVRQLVQQAVQELGYEARNPTKSNTRIIRLFCSDLETLPTHIFFNELLSGIFSVTQQNDYDVIVTPVPKSGDSNNPINFSSDMLGDGILVINPRNNPKFLEAIKKSKVPCLIIGRPGDGDDDLSYVDVDNVAVGYQMTKHLLDKDHRDITFVNGPEDYTISQDRLSGYRLALAEADCSFEQNSVINCDYTVDAVHHAFSEYLDRHPLPTAVVANSDTLTLGVLGVLSERKIKVPKECSIICGGEGILMTMYPIPITGIDLHHIELGRRAAKTLLKLIDKTLIRVTQYHVPFVLNDRGSVRKK